MSEKDYNNQVVKRQRIRNTTLVVGVDVGNAFNAMGFMNKERTEGVAQDKKSRDVVAGARYL